MKLTKQQTKMHDEAMTLVHSDKTLSPDEVEFVLEHFHPGAIENIGKGGVFFTPKDLALLAAAMHSGGGVILDLCAGIGSLSWELLQHDYMSGFITKIVAVEKNHDFCAIGKRLMPNVEWVCGDAFDTAFLQTLGRFDSIISNPPFGKVAGIPDGPFKRDASLSALHAAIELTREGAIVILPVDTDFRKFNQLHPRFNASECPVDVGQVKWKSAAPKVTIYSIDLP